MSFIIDDLMVPEYLPEGSEVNVSILVRNIGALAYFDFFIDGNYTAPDQYMMVEAGRTDIQIPTGESMWIDIFIRYFKMPPWNFTLIAKNEDNSSQMAKTILVGVKPTTSITIMAPSSVFPGEVFSIYGALKITNLNLPVEGAQVYLLCNNVMSAITTTNNLGEYLFQTSLEQNGVYTLNVVFAGSVEMEGSSASTNITITPVNGPVNGVSNIIPLIIGAGAVLYLTTKK